MIDKKHFIDELKGMLNSIAQHEPGELARGKGLGDLNFQHVLPLLTQSIELAKEMLTLPLDILTNSMLEKLKSPIDSLSNHIIEIAKFSIIGLENPEITRNKLIDDTQKGFDNLFNVAMRFIPYLTLKSAQVQDNIASSNELIQIAKDKFNKTIAEVEVVKEDIIKKTRSAHDAVIEAHNAASAARDAVSAAQDAVSKVGVSKFATIFKEIASEHSSASKKWLWATTILGVLTVFIAFIFVRWLPPVGAMYESGTIQQIITRLVAISIFYFAAFWSGKNYRTHRHLSVVNRHRQSALSTFETFVNATVDKHIKDAVLLEATHCIFSPVVSGYLGSDEENPSTRIIEILKTASSSTSG